MHYIINSIIKSLIKHLLLKFASFLLRKLANATKEGYIETLNIVYSVISFPEKIDLSKKPIFVKNLVRIYLILILKEYCKIYYYINKYY